VYGRVLSVAVLGIRGRVVSVEAHVGRGLPALVVTGLPGAGVQDARERVRPAVESCGLTWPLRRVVVNLAPANVRKEGSGFDLPLALGVLAASAQVPGDRLDRLAFCGELSLKGELIATPGVLAVAMAAAEAGLEGVVVPLANREEAGLVEGLRVVGAPSLAAVVGYLRGSWQPDGREAAAAPDGAGVEAFDRDRVDLAEVRGQAVARRALEIAAAGGHNALLVGPPGAGKTMLARRLPTILPAMTRREALEVTRLHSVAGVLQGGLVGARPFRMPHHTVSPAALLGGGSGLARPGAMPWRDCASRLRTAAWWSRGAAAWSSSRPGSRSSPPPTRARAGSTGTGDGGARVCRTGSCSTASACPARCSTASTSSCSCRASPARS
jgi:magnesium chelatase family protein